MRVLFRDQTITSRAAAMGRRLGATFRGPVLWLTVCGGLLVAAIFAGTIMMIGEFRERALANSERELENTVLLLTRHFDQQFDDSDTIAADVISRLRIPGIAIARERSGNGCRPRTPMKSCGPRPACCPISATSRFTTPNGDMINWSRPLPVPDLNISERTYFKTFKSDPHSPSVRTEAIRSLINGNLNTVIAHRLSGENGTFLGVMTRRIDPANYEKFFASVAIGAGAAISMFHADGTLMARYPHVDRAGRTEIQVSAAAGAGPEPRAASRRCASQPGRQYGPARLRARLSRFPIMVVATNTIAAALADWREQTSSSSPRPRCRPW